MFTIALLAAACAFGLAATAVATGASGPVSVTNYVSYTKGKAGPANKSLAPVKIAWVNNEGGQVIVAPPSVTQAARFAVRYINERAGGIGGHPVQLVECPVKNSEEEGTTCGQKLLNDKSVHIIALGGLAVGSSAMHGVIKGKKPIVCSICVGPGDATAPNTYILGGTYQTVSWPWGTFGKSRGAKTAAVIYPAGPGFQGPATAVAEGYRAAGIKTTVVGFDPKTTDLTGALQAAGVANVDQISTQGDPASCVLEAKALDQLGVDPSKVASSPLCLTASVKEALGDYPKWFYGTAQDNLGANRPQTVALKKVLTQYKMAKHLTDPWFAAAFGTIMTVAQWMNTVGYDKLSPATVAGAAKKFKGPFLLGQPNLQCGKYPKIPASCSDQTIFFRYQGNGKFALAAEWIQPPPSLQPKKK